MAEPPRLSDPLFVMIGELMLVNGRIKSIFARPIAASGVTSMAYAVFTMISDASAPPTVPQIGRSLGHARQVIQRAINELLAAGLVEALPNPQHKRMPLLRLSPAGARFKQESDSRVMATAAGLLRHVDHARCRRIARDLSELRGQIEAYLREEAAAPRLRRGKQVRDN